jgi:hypothetical protein
MRVRAIELAHYRVYTDFMAVDVAIYPLALVELSESVRVLFEELLNSCFRL